MATDYNAISALAPGGVHKVRATEFKQAERKDGSLLGKLVLRFVVVGSATGDEDDENSILFFDQWIPNVKPGSKSPAFAAKKRMEEVIDIARKFGVKKRDIPFRTGDPEDEDDAKEWLEMVFQKIIDSEGEAWVSYLPYVKGPPTLDSHIEVHGQIDAGAIKARVEQFQKGAFVRPPKRGKGGGDAASSGDAGSGAGGDASGDTAADPNVPF